MSQMSISFQEMLDRANACVETISPTAALDFRSDEAAMFIDIRDIRELEREGMIPGAKHCPRGMLEFWVHPESPYHKSMFAEDKKFIFYCASGWRSALATDTVQRLGLTNVAHLGGGFSAWKEAGGDVAEKAKRS